MLFLSPEWISVPLLPTIHVFIQSIFIEHIFYVTVAVLDAWDRLVCKISRVLPPWTYSLVGIDSNKQHVRRFKCYNNKIKNRTIREVIGKW